MGEPLVIEFVDFNAVRITSVIGVALFALGFFVGGETMGTGNLSLSGDIGEAF